jgi:hypothetical protein
MIAATPLNKSGSLGWPELSKSITHFPRDFLLVWDWGKPLGESHNQEEYKTLTKTNSRVLEHLKMGLEGHLEKPTRTWNIALILGDLVYHFFGD